MKMKNPRKYTTYILLVLVILAYSMTAAWLGYLGWHTTQLLRLAFQAQQTVQGGVENLKPDQAQDLLHRASQHLSALDGGLKLIYPQLRLVSALPVVGEIAGQVQPLIQFAAFLAQAGDQTIAGLAPFWSSGDPTLAAKPAPERLFLVLKAGRARFDTASQALDQASQARRQIAPQVLPERLRSLIAQIDRGYPLLQSGVSFLALAPDLMGDSRPAPYLVLAQNRDELRATGGFISGLGVVSLEQGRIAGFQIGDSYTVDDYSKPYPPPPEPIQRLMLAGYWVTRDGNWSPDFPSAAKQVQALYTLSTGVETQGVIAFDQAAVGGLIAATGPISLPDMPEPVTAKNVESIMQQSWEPEPGSGFSEEWWRGRKDFMGVLGKALIENILHSQEPKALLSLGKAVVDLVETGHLLVYFNQPEAQDLLESIGLAHRLEPGTGDYLMVVDSNFGFNKTDALIQRSIHYRVDLSDPAHPSARLALGYTHTGQKDVACVHEASYGTGTYSDLEERCYWDYWRVYTPTGSALTAAQAKPVPGEQLLGGTAWPGVVESYPGEDGTQVFAGVLLLPTRAQEKIRLEYALPGTVVVPDGSGGWRYTLRVQKQPGIGSSAIQVEVILPEGYAISSGSQGWKQSSPSSWIWSAQLDRDQVLELSIAPAP